VGWQEVQNNPGWVARDSTDFNFGLSLDEQKEKSQTDTAKQQ